MAITIPLRAIVDKASDIVLVSILFGAQAVLATGHAARWLS